MGRDEYIVLSYLSIYCNGKMWKRHKKAINQIVTANMNYLIVPFPYRIFWIYYLKHETFANKSPF